MDKKLTSSAEPTLSKDIYRVISSNPFVISAGKVNEILQRYDLEVEELMRLLIPFASSYARPPISNYKVGVSILGKSGAIYLGVNLEFLGVPLNEAVHGEQFAITNARNYGETELIAIALSAAPCGHCRQFMNEMYGSERFQVLIPNSSPIPLSSLLPDSFGPKDLDVKGNLLSSTIPHDSSTLNNQTPLATKALEGAFRSYAPYTNSKSGIAIQTKDQKIFIGSYLENAAFNPSLSPLQAALISLVADKRDYSEIDKVLLVEQKSAKISQEIMSREILSNIAPEAIFNVDKY